MASIDYSIKEIEKVVKIDGKIKDVQVTRLTAPGENYLSLILKVDIEVDKNEHLETVHVVAKCLPLTGMKGEFNFHGHAMKNEIRWYSEIVPILKNFAKEHDISLNFFPEYIGSRFSLDSLKQEPDSDAVLLLENLIPQGYKNDDRYIGSDLKTSKAILKSLALFHAIPIAIKETKPELFKTLKDFLDTTQPDFSGENGPPGPDGHRPPGPPGPDGRKGPPQGPDGERKGFGPPPGVPKPEEILCEELAKIPEFSPYLSKIKILLQNQQMGPGSHIKSTKEPWSTITHSDFWVNNVMVNASTEQEPLVKIVDYQMTIYGSFAKDVVFFLLSSVKNEIARESMDYLLRFYYDEFISILQKTNTNLVLTYEDYLEEIRLSAMESEVTHALTFSTVIFGEKGTGVDAAVEEFDPFKFMHTVLRNMNQHHKDKLVLIASEADKQNWIKSF